MPRMTHDELNHFLRFVEKTLPQEIARRAADPTGKTVLVGTGNGAVVLRDVQPAGKRMIPAVDWARGARPAAGEKVGE